MTGTQPIGQGEALEARARELLAEILEVPVKDAATYSLGKFHFDRAVELVTAALSAPQQPVKQDAVREADGLERGVAQFFFEVGYGACWAEAYVRNGSNPPFPLTDALVEHAWEIAGEAHDDPEEFDRYLALATPPLDNTVGLDAGTVERCAEVADAVRFKFGSLTGSQYDGGLWDQSIRIAIAIRALASGDRS